MEDRARRKVRENQWAKDLKEFLGRVPGQLKRLVALRRAACGEWKEQAGYVMVPHGLLRHPGWRALSADTKAIYMYALDSAFWADSFDKKVFEMEEAKAMAEKNPQCPATDPGRIEPVYGKDGFKTGERKAGPPRLYRRYYLLNGVFMTWAKIRKFVGVSDPTESYAALRELGLLRIRWAIASNRHNRVPFFIVYDNIDVDRGLSPAPGILWKKLADRSKPYFEEWNEPEDLMRRRRGRTPYYSAAEEGA